MSLWYPKGIEPAHSDNFQQHKKASASPEPLKAMREPKKVKTFSEGITIGFLIGMYAAAALYTIASCL